MKTHTIERESYHIFKKSEAEKMMGLYFIWGKKDFRMYLEPWTEGREENFRVKTEEGTMYSVSCLEYLYNYEWYAHSGLSGHGLGREENVFQHKDNYRHLETPLHFKQVALELVCREFGLEKV